MKKLITTRVFLAGLACFLSPSLHAQTTNIWNFNFSGSIVQWTVPSTGIYDLTAYGAQGGQGYASQANPNSNNIPGGLGAQIGGSFQLDEGQTLNILVGGAGVGLNVQGIGQGGGGGSFVVVSSSTPLVVAGGGGGPAGTSDSLMNATTNTSGNNAPFYKANKQGSGGTNGNGGTIGSDSA